MNVFNDFHFSMSVDRELVELSEKRKKNFEKLTPSLQQFLFYLKIKHRVKKAVALGFKGIVLDNSNIYVSHWLLTKLLKKGFHIRFQLGLSTRLVEVKLLSNGLDDFPFSDTNWIESMHISL